MIRQHTITPADFERQFGVNAKTLRGYLRDRYPEHGHYDRWRLNPAMVVDARAHFAR